MLQSLWPRPTFQVFIAGQTRPIVDAKRSWVYKKVLFLLLKVPSPLLRSGLNGIIEHVFPSSQGEPAPRLVPTFLSEAS